MSLQESRDLDFRECLLLRSLEAGIVQVVSEPLESRSLVSSRLSSFNEQLERRDGSLVSGVLLRSLLVRPRSFGSTLLVQIGDSPFSLSLPLCAESVRSSLRDSFRLVLSEGSEESKCHCVQVRQVTSNELDSRVAEREEKFNVSCQSIQFRNEESCSSPPASLESELQLFPLGIASGLDFDELLEKDSSFGIDSREDSLLLSLEPKS